MRILVWDWPVRVFHGLLVLAFAGSWLTSGDDRYTYAHAYFGYIAMWLLVFRVVWGFIGTRHALFRSFAVSPVAALHYADELLAHRAQRYITHNPVGSWAVWLLLGLTLALTVTGLLTLGGEEQQGPLAGVIDRIDGALVGEWHELIAWAGVALIAVHVLGVIVEGRAHRENLVRSMLDGHKRGELADAIPSARGAAAVMLCVVLAGFSLWYFSGYFTATAEKPYLPYTSPALPMNAQWTEECGSCHLAYHPSLLPAASWQALLAQQQTHFGEDLMLDAVMIATLEKFARAHSARHGESEAAIKISASMAGSSAKKRVLRITGTPYWQLKHASIPEEAWRTKPVHGKFDCAACHHDAEKATFEDSAMRLP